MDLPDYAGVLRRRWLWAAIPFLAVLVGGGWLAVTTPPVYRSTATLYYAEPAQNLTPPLARLNSFAILATSDRLLEDVRSDLGLAVPTQDLTSRLSASVRPETSLLAVTATGTTAQQAQSLAAAAARRLVTTSESLQDQAAGLPQGRLSVSDPATPAESGSQAEAARTVSLAALLGLILAVLAALLREAVDPRIIRPDQVRRLAPYWEVFELDPADGIRPTPETTQRLQAHRRSVLDRVPKGCPAVVVAGCRDDDQVAGITDGIALSAAQAAIDVVRMSAQIQPGRSLPPWARARPGLSAVLLGEATLGEAVATVASPAPSDAPSAAPSTRIHLLPAGRSLSRPHDVLTSPDVLDVVEELRSRSDLLLIDAPCFLSPSGTAALVQAGGAAVLVVVRGGRTPRRALRATVALLDSTKAPVIGAVLVPDPVRRGIDAVTGPDDASDARTAPATSPARQHQTAS